MALALAPGLEKPAAEAAAEAALAAEEAAEAAAPATFEAACLASSATWPHSEVPT